MIEEVATLQNLGKLGLIERLSKVELKEGIENFNRIAETIKSKEYERSPYIGDDFCPDTNLYNTLGAIYPALSKAERIVGLKTILTQMDSVNYLYVNRNHTPHIRDPQLLSDITISRLLYWPGLYDEKNLWKRKKSFEEIKKEIIEENGLFDVDKVKSDFLVAYSLLRSDFTNFGEEYMNAANPQFLNRVLKGIVALMFGRAKNDSDIENGRKRLQKLLPKRLNEQIGTIKKEADWIVIN